MFSLFRFWLVSFLRYNECDYVCLHVKCVRRFVQTVFVGLGEKKSYLRKATSFISVNSSFDKMLENMRGAPRLQKEEKKKRPFALNLTMEASEGKESGGKQTEEMWEDEEKRIWRWRRDISRIKDGWGKRKNGRSLR